MTEATPVVQFGTSRFLQAHADLFFDEGTPRVAVTVVQSSGDPGRARRLAALASPDGYPVRIRGLEGGRTIDETRRVQSVRRALSTATDWDAVAEAVAAADFVVSNTADAGFAPQPADDAAAPEQAMSFPGKLAHLLRARYDAGRPPPTMLPTELVSRNGDVLKARVIGIAAAVDGRPGFRDWLHAAVWANSLVDRIVSEALEPAGAVAEPYALWAVEDAPGLTLPTAHPAIRRVADLNTVERLKLHILNLGHTVMADAWMAAGAPPGTLVREVMADARGRAVEAILREEVLPGFAARGLGAEAEQYAAVTLERFRNPFLDHRLADIAVNHREKIARRIGAFLDWVDPDGPPAPRLAAIRATG